MEFNNEYTSIVCKRLFENGVQDSDRITLVSGEDNQKISIHRVILTAVSKYFAAALGPNFEESDQSEFILDGIDGSLLRAIVDFCYTGHINLTEENVSKCLAIASSRELDLLEQKCWNFLAENISVNNAVQTWMIADKYSNSELYQRAFRLICESFERISIQDIQSIEHRFLVEILKSDSLHATEEHLFQRLMYWFQFNEGEREPLMTALLKMIRLEHISQQFLEDNQLDVAFERFGCVKLIHFEYRRRALSGNLAIGTRRRCLILCLFAQYKEEEGADLSAVRIERYNSALNAFEDAGEIELGDRKYFGVTLHENKVFIVGGVIARVFQKSVSMFDLATAKEEVLPEMNFARAGVSLIVHGKHIYVFGGSVGPDRLNLCERFDLKTKTWTILKPMNVARDSASVAVFHGYIYVAGGRTSDTVRVNVVELYDPATDEWLQVASMNETRSSFTLFTSNMFLYAIGSRETVERYDAVKPRWQNIGTFDRCANVTSSVVTDNEIFVMQRTGDFGKFDVDANGVCSFQLMGKSKLESNFIGKHFLFLN